MEEEQGVRTESSHCLREREWKWGTEEGSPLRIQGGDPLKAKVADGVKAATNTADSHVGTKAGHLSWKAHSPLY